MSETASAPTTLADALARGLAEPPAWAGLIEHEGKRRLAVLCFELAGRAWGGRFFLGGRSAGGLLGADQSSVSQWLRDLERLRLVVCVRKGSSFTGESSEFAWVHQGTEKAREPRPRRRSTRTVNPTESA